MAAQHRKAVGRRIRELRDERGWSQADLARRMTRGEKVDGQAVSRWERGQHYPDKHLAELAEVLGTTESDIMAGSPEGGRQSEPKPAPDVMGTLGNGQADRLDRIEAKLDEILTQLAALDLKRLEDDLDRLLDPDDEPPEEEQPGAGGQ